MASAETKRKMCVMCLEDPADRQSETCQHFYCGKCMLSSSFACPQCVTAGSQSQEVGSFDEGTQYTRQGTKRTATGDQGSSTCVTVNQNCRLCHFKGETVRAANKCKDCKSIPLCVDCSKAHRKSKATEKHVVVSLDSSEKELCDEHGDFTDLYCKTCSKTLCHICVSLNHSEHEVDQFNIVVAVEAERIRTALEHQERRLDMFKSDENEIRKSKATVQEMEDALIRSIEDHAEKCIEEILKNKDALKKQVRSDFEVGRVLEKRLEIMAGLQATIAAANRLLDEQAEVHPKYVAKLVSLKEELVKLKEGQPDYEEDKAKYQQDFQDLREKAITFYPRTPYCKIGGFQDLYYSGPRCNDGGPCVCETCERKADASRVVECRQKGTCTCGTCGCVFNRKRLEGRGTCVSTYILCKKIMACNSKITVSNDFTFP